MNPRDEGFSKRPKLYISSLKPAGFAESGVKSSFSVELYVYQRKPGFDHLSKGVKQKNQGFDHLSKGVKQKNQAP
ncbi:hypothetical protein ACROYT_G018740 [Oculina patagonica]